MSVSTFERKIIDLGLNHSYRENNQQSLSLPALLGLQLTDLSSVFLDLALILSTVHFADMMLTFFEICEMHTRALINKRFEEL